MAKTNRRQVEKREDRQAQRHLDIALGQSDRKRAAGRAMLTDCCGKMYRCNCKSYLEGEE